MADRAPQSFEQHARYITWFHFVCGPILVINLVWAGYHLVREPSGPTVMSTLVAFALAQLFYYSRAQPLTVQNRLIRLEERLRMQRLLPAAMQDRIKEFTPRQLIALRFASDAELPELARRVLDEQIEGQTEIKKLIRQWRPDYLRV
jgi:hypothetical protein